MHVPDLSPLTDAFFETDDPVETDFISHMTESFQHQSPWLKRFLKSGEAATILKPYALKALQKVVDDCDDFEETERQMFRQALQFHDVQEAVDLDSPVQELDVDSPDIPFVDLVSEYGDGVVGFEREGDVEVVKEVKEVVREAMTRSGKKRLVAAEARVPDLGTRRVIVSALRCPEPDSERKKKGKEKVGTKKGKEKVVEGIAAPKTPDVGVAIGKEKEHDIFVEDDSNNLRRFKVVEDYVENMDLGPDIPLSPCVSNEWDPEFHTFLLLRKGNAPSR